MIERLEGFEPPTRALEGHCSDPTELQAHVFTDPSFQHHEVSEYTSLLRSAAFS